MRQTGLQVPATTYQEDNTMHDFFEPMKIQLAREAIKFAITRTHDYACPVCRDILDVDNTVLTVGPAGSGQTKVYCGPCFETVVTRAAKKAGLTFNEWIRMATADGVTIDDGRVLKKLYDASFCSD
jgi:hypothetical protein